MLRTSSFEMHITPSPEVRQEGSEEIQATQSLRRLLENKPSLEVFRREVQHWAPFVITPGERMRVIMRSLGALNEKTSVTRNALNVTLSFLDTCDDLGWFSSVPPFLESDLCNVEAHAAMHALEHKLSKGVKEDDGRTLCKLLALLENLALKPDGTRCRWAPGLQIPHLLAYSHFPLLNALAREPTAFYRHPLTQKRMLQYLKNAIVTTMSFLTSSQKENLEGTLTSYGARLFNVMQPLYPNLVTSEFWREALAFFAKEYQGSVGLHEGYTLILTAAQRAHEASVLQQTLDAATPSALTDTLSPTRRRL